VQVHWHSVANASAPTAAAKTSGFSGDSCIEVGTLSIRSQESTQRGVALRLDGRSGKLVGL
jgi:hypothetical protein